VDELLQRGYIIRGLQSYGLEDYVRISIGTERENKGLVQACKDIQDGYA
jgi:histidinol-phosphate aminotransferase